MDKISIRFFDDREVRAVWDDETSKWWFSVLDIISVLRSVDDYTKNRNYWKYLKAKLKREHNQLGSVTTQFKMFLIMMALLNLPKTFQVNRSIVLSNGSLTAMKRLMVRANQRLMLFLIVLCLIL